MIRFRLSVKLHVNSCKYLDCFQKMCPFLLRLRFGLGCLVEAPKGLMSTAVFSYPNINGVNYFKSFILVTQQHL